MSVNENTHEETPEHIASSPSYFRIFVAGITSGGNLVYTDQDSENGPSSGTFTQLTNNTYDTTPLQASTTLNGYVALLAQQTGSQHLLYISEKHDGSSTDRFNDPVDLGLPSSVSAFQDTKLINGLNGLDNIFGTSADADNTIWWKFRNPYTTTTKTETVTPPGTDDPIEVTVEVPAPPSQPWSDWLQLPGALKTITATNNADGRLIIAGLNSDKYPYLNIQTSDNPFAVEGWKGWEYIGGPVGQFEQLELAIDGNALVHVFASVGSNIYMRVQTEVSKDEFTDWVLFAAFDQPVHTFAVGIYCNDGLYLTAQVGSGDGSPVYGTHQVGEHLATWTTPSVIAFAQSDSQLILQPNADTKLSLFALNVSSQILDYTNQLVPDFWQAGWTQVGKDLASVTITQDITPTSDK